jgi:hypothetical protein
MKTLISLLLFCLLAIGFQACAQNNVCNNIYNSYEGKKGFLTLNITGSLLNQMFNDGDKKGNCKINSIKILVVEDSLLKPKYNFYKEIVPKLNTRDYEELMKMKKDGKEMVILCKRDKKNITEFILVTGGKENSMIYIDGELSLADCKKVSEDFNVEYNFDEMEQKIQD